MKTNKLPSKQRNSGSFTFEDAAVYFILCFLVQGSLKTMYSSKRKIGSYMVTSVGETIVVKDSRKKEKKFNHERIWNEAAVLYKGLRRIHRKRKIAKKWN